MSAKKQKHGAAWLLGPGRPLLIVVVLVGLLAGGATLAWFQLRGRILASADYRVTAQQIELTPLPAWIHSDVREEAFQGLTLGGAPSLLDDDLVERIAQQAAAHPWVAKVISVKKRHPASVRVEVIYRKPVCMVRVAGGLLPVDAEGTLLPSGDFSPTEATRYPRLDGVEPAPSIPAGSRWTDARVIGGAEIAAAIGNAWEPLGLRSIVPLASRASDADSKGRASEPMFALETRGGRRILWGYAPGVGMAGELSAPEKLARLERYAADHDSLDDPQAAKSELDIRKLPPAAGR